jgi:hypothetical protein
MSGAPFHSLWKFEGRTAADAIQLATEAYECLRPLRARGVVVGLASDVKEMREAAAAFMAGKSNVLKLCPAN